MSLVKVPSTFFWKTNSLLLPAAVMLVRFEVRGVPEDLPERLRVLLKNVAGHREVPFQALDLPPEVLVHVGHVGPLFDFAEELRQAAKTRTVNQPIPTPGNLTSDCSASGDLSG